MHLSQVSFPLYSLLFFLGIFILSSVYLILSSSFLVRSYETLGPAAASTPSGVLPPIKSHRSLHLFDIFIHHSKESKRESRRVLRRGKNGWLQARGSLLVKVVLIVFSGVGPNNLPFQIRASKENQINQMSMGFRTAEPC